MSRTILRQVRRQYALHDVLKASREPSVEGLCERFAPLLDEGEDLEDALGLLLDVLERCLERHLRNLDRVERKHSSHQRDVERLRAERDEVSREVRQELVEIRSTLAGFFNRQTSNWMVGIYGPTAKAKDPLMVLNQARVAIDHLGDPEYLPEDLSGVAKDLPLESWRRSWRASLESGYARLDPLYQAALEQGSNRRTLRRKDQAVALHSEDLSAIAHLQEALLILGRQRRLARKVWQEQRPKGRPARRKARTKSRTEPPKSPRKVSSKEVGPTKKQKKKLSPHQGAAPNPRK